MINYTKSVMSENAVTIIIIGDNIIKLCLFGGRKIVYKSMNKIHNNNKKAIILD